ncbi:hypothetical protein GBA52_011923 [Prunus armeniaca]|nr:hypothetical protein GBA52_011923 [Prunus armeniaca]
MASGSMRTSFRHNTEIPSVLAMCHTAIPVVNKKSGEITYEAESPDEAAFVIAARELGFEFFEGLKQAYHCMSWILKLGKRLAKAGRQFEDQTKEHIHKYAEAGLRTLVIAYRELGEEEFKIWEKEFLKAKSSVTEGRDLLVDGVADKIETDLILLGVTAVEDKLQKGYACSLLRQDMKQIVISLDLPDINALSKQTRDKEAVEKVTRLVKLGTGKITLSVGDGANDVGMLQEADIGVGISGVEGMQYPSLYLEGVENLLFSWTRILGWMVNGVLSSIIIFFFTTNSMVGQALRRDGKVVDYEVLGVTMYTCVVWVVNCQMALSINYFTWIQHFFIWGSIVFWYIFLVIYGSVSPNVSTTAHKVLVEACAPSPLYWLVTLLSCHLHFATVFLIPGFPDTV